MKGFKAFETERLILKPTSEEDAEFILALFNTPKWLKFIGDRNVKSIVEAREYINNKMLPQFERLGFANYTVVRKIDGAKIGICGLYDRDGLDGLDLGFAFLPEYEGQGFAFEAANYLKQLAFAELGINELIAITSQDNRLSQKLLEKLDFTYVGIIQLPNDNEDLCLYRILNS